LIKLALNTNHSINQLNHIVNNYLVHFLERKLPHQSPSYLQERKNYTEDATLCPWTYS
jgi:hypothetical protein